MTTSLRSYDASRDYLRIREFVIDTFALSGRPFNWLLDRFEPVGTRAEYQGMGLGRALLTAGLQLMAANGATRSCLDSGADFYRKVGFRETPYSYNAWIKYYAV